MSQIEQGARTSSVAVEALCTAAQAAAIGLLVLAPWSASNSLADQSGWVMAGGGVVLLVYALLFPFGRGHRLLSLGSALTAAFLLWSVLTWPWSLSLFHTQERWAVWVAAWGVMLVMQDVTRTRRRVHATLDILTLGVTVYALSSLALTGEAAAAHQGFHVNTLHFTNPDAFAALLLMGYGLAMGAALNRPRHSLPWLVSTAESGVLGLTVLATGSRTGIGGMAAATVFLLWVALKRGRKLLEVLPVLTGPGLAFCCLAMLVVLGDVRDPLLRFKNLVVLNDTEGGDYERLAQLQVRGMVLTHGPRTVARAPLVGAGLDNFALAFQRDRPRSLFRGYVNQGHCDIMQLAVETGLVGLALWLAVWILALRQPVRRAQDSMTTGASASLVGVAFFGLANFAHCMDTDMLWIAALLGMALRDVREIMSSYLPPPRWQLRGVVAGSALLAGLGAWLCYYGSLTVRANEAAYRADAEERAYHWANALQDLSLAAHLRPANADYRLHLGLTREKLAQYVGKQALLREANQDVDAAEALAPIDRDVPVLAGAFYLRVGRQADAERVLKAAAEWYPQDYRRWMTLSQVYLAEQRLTDAADALRRAAPNYPDAVPVLAGVLANLQVSKASGTPLLAVDTQVDPQASDVWFQTGLQMASMLAQSDPIDAQKVLGLVAGLPKVSYRQQVQVAAMEARLHRVDQATTLLRGILQSSAPEAVTVQKDALLTLVDAEVNSGRQDLAVKDLQDWLQANTWDMDARKRLAGIYVAAGHLTKAIALYADAVDEGTSDASVHAELGDLYVKNGDDIKALGAYEEAARLAPDNAAYAAKVKQLSNL